MDNFYETIKFTFDWSYTEVNFLDVTVKLQNGVVSTDLYSKPTDKHQYLFYTSCHPNSCKKGIPFGQALRLRRICSQDTLFEKRAKELTSYLVERGYDERFVTKEVDRARRIPRADTLKEKSKRQSNRVPFVITYHPGLPNIGELLHRFHPVLQTSQRLASAVKEVPMVAYRRPRCLKDFLVRAECRTEYQQTVNKGCFKCGRTNCMICDYLVEGNRFSSFTTKQNFFINHHLNCNSSSVVYLIFCKRCGLQYIGSTITKFRQRFNNHKSRMTKHSRKSSSSWLRDDVIYQHYSLEGHCGLTDVGVMLIDYGSSEEILREKEARWAYRLDTFSPHGLNVEEYIYL